MKNIFILSTDQPSRLHHYVFGSWSLSKEPLNWRTASHIYITSDEEIKEGDWFIHHSHNTTSLHQAKSVVPESIITTNDEGCWMINSKKIILTDNSKIIADGVQSIDNDFLEWFVKNPTCEFVEVKIYPLTYQDGITFDKMEYQIIIPQEELKQESLEEAAENYCSNNHAINEDRAAWQDIEFAFKDGANWQAERMYSEEEVINAFNEGQALNVRGKLIQGKEWFEQFKKK